MFEDEEGSGSVFYDTEMENGIAPYQFEPMTDGESAEEEEECQMDDDDWLHLDRWCSCDNCQPMSVKRECLCCRKTDQVNSLVLTEEINCITDHRDFGPICLHEGVLDVAWLAYKQQYKKNAYEGLKHARLRHVAYRQFVRWTQGYLGKDIRVVLPSCVVCKGRAFFPPPGLEEDAHFEGVHMFDE
ncbi:P2X purinoceptor 7-like [Lineus longissimus]|uniref:P2X purinoceptor 7-like n=1 Tax=Lineus longissimus TaxID=88925 RepID=UPI00315CD850